MRRSSGPARCSAWVSAAPSSGSADAEAAAPRGAARRSRRLGAKPWAAQAGRLLGDATPAADCPSPLTKQERQVAPLVGRGATNREAAEQLFLSPRTIDFHLRNIYKKLGVRSRTELAVQIAAQDSTTVAGSA